MARTIPPKLSSSRSTGTTPNSNTTTGSDTKTAGPSSSIPIPKAKSTTKNIFSQSRAKRNGTLPAKKTLVIRVAPSPRFKNQNQNQNPQLITPPTIAISVQSEEQEQEQEKEQKQAKAHTPPPPPEVEGPPSKKLKQSPGRSRLSRGAARVVQPEPGPEREEENTIESIVEDTVEDKKVVEGEPQTGDVSVEEGVVDESLAPAEAETEKAGEDTNNGIDHDHEEDDQADDEEDDDEREHEDDGEEGENGEDADVEDLGNEEQGDMRQYETSEISAGSLPDMDEWNDKKIYRPYKSFRRSDTDPHENIFVGDYVHIWGLPEEEPTRTGRIRWCAKVTNIKAKSSDKVFMEVAWLFTSRAQLKDSKIIVSKKQHLAKNEVVISDERDIINVWCLEGKASVKKFDELDPWQEEIDSDDEYYRSEVVKDKAGRSRVSPFQPITCKSRKPYKPPPYQATPMVYCPRPTCQKWYHQKFAKKIDTPTEDQREELRSSGLELLDSRPKQDDEERTAETETDDQDWDEDAAWSIINRFAESSITRGDDSIVGNSIPVLEAREVLQASEGNADEKKQAEVLLKKWLKRHEPLDDEDDVARWTCPDCSGII